MNNQFTDYETAKMFKELGFDKPCFKVYDTMGFLQEQKVMDEMSLEYCLAPLWQQAEEWLWEEHKMELWHVGVGKKFKYAIVNNRLQIHTAGENLFASPIVARTEGIKQAVKYLYEKNKQ